MTLYIDDLDLGEALKLWREKMGYSQREAARRLGTTQARIHRLEAEGGNRRYKQLRKIEARLKIILRKIESA